jgi:hypothetical protein
MTSRPKDSTSRARAIPTATPATDSGASPDAARASVMPHTAVTTLRQ